MAAMHVSTLLRDALDECISEYEHGEDPAGPWLDRVVELMYEIQAVTE